MERTLTALFPPNAFLKSLPGIAGWKPELVWQLELLLRAGLE
jgi:hypothetical protein